MKENVLNTVFLNKWKQLNLSYFSAIKVAVKNFLILIYFFRLFYNSIVFYRFTENILK